MIVRSRTQTLSTGRGTSALTAKRNLGVVGARQLSVLSGATECMKVYTGGMFSICGSLKSAA